MKNKYNASDLFISFILLTYIFTVPFSVFANHTSDRERSSLSGSLYSSKINDLDNDVVDKIPVPILFGIMLRIISPNFGDDRDGGDRTHEGLDIMAPRGALIISPTEAVVIRTGSGTNSGKTVTTANPGGETFVYMHLDDIEVQNGQVLKEGDLIGYVGNTGNASGGAPHLHFEIRDKDRDATDPHPRIGLELSLKDKINFLEKALETVDDEDKLADFVVENYSSELRQSKTLGIELPADIDRELQKILVTNPFTTPTSSTDIGDLALNSQGPQVVTLQNILISKNIGPAALALGNAGATGYFGMITQGALIEYQSTYGIIPSAGYYGPKTRAYMTTN